MAVKIMQYHSLLSRLCTFEDFAIDMKITTNELNALNELVHNSILSDTIDKLNSPHKVISTTKGKLYFSGKESYNYYVENVDSLYNLRPSIRENFAKITFEKYLLEQIIPSIKYENRKTDEQDVDALFDHFEKQPRSSIGILREIDGVTFESEKLLLGNYTIINTSYSSEIYNKFNKVCSPSEIPNFLIEIYIDAKDPKKVIEKADLKYEEFENILAYMIADLSHKKKVTINNLHDLRNKNIFLHSEKGVHFQEDFNYSLISDLSDKYFIDSANGNKKIWEIYSKKNNNDLEKRIMNAIQWIGKALQDHNNSRALIQLLFAIESILHIEKDKVIVPSIMSQISDNIAFLLCIDTNDRKKMASSVKQLYILRSGIVHGSNTTVTSSDLHNALKISKLCIKKLLVEKPYSTFNSTRDLTAHLIDKKFS